MSISAAVCDTVTDQNQHVLRVDKRSVIESLHYTAYNELHHMKDSLTVFFAVSRWEKLFVLFDASTLVHVLLHLSRNGDVILLF